MKEKKKLCDKYDKEVQHHAKTRESLVKLKCELHTEKVNIQGKKDLIKLNEAKHKAETEAIKSKHLNEVQNQKNEVKLKTSEIALMKNAVKSNNSKAKQLDGIPLKQYSGKNQLDLMNDKANVR
mmetsp:Transcript_16000/g.24945  ORF Transcript_16000/g.24945 Transcript_16000/m.24945 type:complete len:124 (-) Transcript_16000:346-717(-)